MEIQPTIPNVNQDTLDLSTSMKKAVIQRDLEEFRKLLKANNENYEVTDDDKPLLFILRLFHVILVSSDDETINALLELLKEMDTDGIVTDKVSLVAIAAALYPDELAAYNINVTISPKNGN